MLMGAGLKHVADWLPGELPPHFNFSFCKQDGRRIYNTELRKVGVNITQKVNPTNEDRVLVEQLLVGVDEASDAYGVVARLKQSSTVTKCI